MVTSRRRSPSAPAGGDPPAARSLGRRPPRGTACDVLALRGARTALSGRARANALRRLDAALSPQPGACRCGYRGGRALDLEVRGLARVRRAHPKEPRCPHGPPPRCVRLAVLMLDGIELKGHTNVVALGITTEGVKSRSGSGRARPRTPRRHRAAGGPRRPRPRHLPRAPVRNRRGKGAVQGGARCAPALDPRPALRTPQRAQRARPPPRARPPLVHRGLTADPAVGGRQRA